MKQIHYFPERRKKKGERCASNYLFSHEFHWEDISLGRKEAPESFHVGEKVCCAGCVKTGKGKEKKKE